MRTSAFLRASSRNGRHPNGTVPTGSPGVVWRSYRLLLSWDASTKTWSLLTTRPPGRHWYGGLSVFYHDYADCLSLSLSFSTSFLASHFLAISLYVSHAFLWLEKSWKNEQAASQSEGGREETAAMTCHQLVNPVWWVVRQTQGTSGAKKLVVCFYLSGAR